MAISTQPQKAAELTGGASNGALPPLENGDRLTRAEFERRYDAMPHLKKAELIEGEVYMPSPVRHAQHGHPHAQLIWWLGSYETDTPGVGAAANCSVRLDVDNEPQPDGLLIILPERGGNARISEDDFIEGAPELVAEVASSSVSYDLGKKLNVYRRSGSARVCRLASARPTGRLVRESRRAIRASGALCRRHSAQHGVSRSLARSGGARTRRDGDGQSSPGARPEVARARRVRGPTRTYEERPEPRSA